MIEEDLPAACGTSPARLEDLVAPTAASLDKLTNPLTLANSMESEGQEYPKWVKVHSYLKGSCCGKCTLQTWRSLAVSQL